MKCISIVCMFLFSLLLLYTVIPTYHNRNNVPKVNLKYPDNIYGGLEQGLRTDADTNCNNTNEKSDNSDDCVFHSDSKVDKGEDTKNFNSSRRLIRSKRDVLSTANGIATIKVDGITVDAYTGNRMLKTLLSVFQDVVRAVSLAQDRMSSIHKRSTDTEQEEKYLKDIEEGLSKLALLKEMKALEEVRQMLANMESPKIEEADNRGAADSLSRDLIQGVADYNKASSDDAFSQKQNEVGLFRTRRRKKVILLTVEEALQKLKFLALDDRKCYFFRLNISKMIRDIKTQFGKIGKVKLAPFNKYYKDWLSRIIHNFQKTIDHLKDISEHLRKNVEKRLKNNPNYRINDFGYEFTKKCRITGETESIRLILCFQDAVKRSIVSHSELVTSLNILNESGEFFGDISELLILLILDLECFFETVFIQITYIACHNKLMDGEYCLKDPEELRNEPENLAFN